MAQLTKRYEVKLSEKQANALAKLREYNVVPSRFIRLAIEDKLERDYKQIVNKQKKFALVKAKKYF